MNCLQRIYITLRTDSPPPLRLPWEALSKPLSALSAVLYTALPVRLYNCRQWREVGRVLPLEDEGGGAVRYKSDIYSY